MMIINLKYYLVTIVAIFLAIGIGIFIGIMMDGQDLIVDQQQQLVAQLQLKFDEFKQKQDELQERIDYLTLEREKNIKFIDKVYPEIVMNKLKDLDVLIIETNENYSYLGLGDSFEKAGMNSVSSLLIKDSFLLDDLSHAQQIAMEFNLKGKTIEEIQGQLIELFCNAVLSGNTNIISSLKEKAMVDFLDQMKVPVDYIIIAGGSLNEEKNVLNKIDLPMIKYIKSNDIPVVAVEKTGTAYSNIPEYKKSRVSTVDNVDTIMGKVSLMMVLSGQEGNFGEKETAEALLPEGFITIE